MILGYLDVNPKNVDVESQKRTISQCAKAYDFDIDLFLKGSDICSTCVFDDKGEHTVIVGNIVSLGTSMEEMEKNIKGLSKKQISLVTAKEEYFWTSDDLKAMPQILRMANELRGSMVSILTTKALSERKSQGIVLGRKSRNRQSKLEKYSNEIRLRKADNQSNSRIAKELNVCEATLSKFLSRHPEIAQLGTKYKRNKAKRAL